MAFARPLFIERSEEDPNVKEPYEALDFRQIFAALATEGVIGRQDLRVSPRAEGSTRSVDVAPGSILIQGDDVARQGMYLQTNEQKINVAWPAAPDSGTRVDRMILTMHDSTAAGAANGPELIPLQGIAASSNAQPPAVPASSLTLAKVTMPAGAATITQVLADGVSGTDGQGWITDERVTATQQLPIAPLILESASLTPAAGSSSYPDGLSLMVIGSTSPTGWPETNGLVITWVAVRGIGATGQRTSQDFYGKFSNRSWHRTRNELDTGWLEWLEDVRSNSPLMVRFWGRGSALKAGQPAISATTQILQNPGSYVGTTSGAGALNVPLSPAFPNGILTAQVTASSDNVFVWRVIPANCSASTVHVQAFNAAGNTVNSQLSRVEVLAFGY